MVEEGSWPESTCEAETPKLSSVAAPFLLYIVLLLTCKVLQLLIICCNTCSCMYVHRATSCSWALTCFSSGSILHCWCYTPRTITKCPCCNPVLSTWYCRGDCNSPPSSCIHILSYHWYSKAGHLISSNQCIGYVVTTLMLTFVFHC